MTQLLIQETLLNYQGAEGGYNGIRIALSLAPKIDKTGDFFNGP